MFDVITIGTATEDVYMVSRRFGGGRQIKLPLGSKLEMDGVLVDTGGGATNAAVTFGRQGFRTAALAKVGNDVPGRVIEAEMRREKIVPFLIRDKKYATAYSTILLSPGGERTILVYRGASENLQEADIPWQKLRSKWIYFASGGIDLPLLTKLVNFFYRRGAFIAINPGKAQLALGLKRLAPTIAKTKVFIVNREEAARLSGVSYKSDKRIFKILDRAVGGILVMTDAGKGAWVSDSRRVWHSGVFKEKMLTDRTGAGDAFGSGFVAGLMHKGERCEKEICRPANIAYALRLASANATANIELIGAKSGLLTKREFAKNRWAKLEIWYTNTDE